MKKGIKLSTAIFIFVIIILVIGLVWMYVYYNNQNNIGNKYLSPIKLIKIYVKKGKIYFIKNLENN